MAPPAAPSGVALWFNRRAMVGAREAGRLPRTRPRAAAIVLGLLVLAGWESVAGQSEPYFETLEIVVPAVPGGGWDLTAQAVRDTPRRRRAGTQYPHFAQPGSRRAYRAGSIYRRPPWRWRDPSDRWPLYGRGGDAQSCERFPARRYADCPAHGDGGCHSRTVIVFRHGF